MFVYFYFILNQWLALKSYGTCDFSNACLDYLTEHNEREASKINSKISVVFIYKSYLIPARKFERNFHSGTTFPLQNLRSLDTLVYTRVHKSFASQEDSLIFFGVGNKLGIGIVDVIFSVGARASVLGGSCESTDLHKGFSRCHPSVCRRGMAHDFRKGCRSRAVRCEREGRDFRIQAVVR